MNTTTGLVILIFLATIFGAFHGSGNGSDKGGFIQNPPVQTDTAVVKTIDILLPPPNYSSGAVGALESIQKFISLRNRKLDEPTRTKIAESIVRYSQDVDVNPRLIAGLIARESSFNSQAVSVHGAQGLGQLLPSTSATLEISDPFDIEQNVRGTTKYVRGQLDRWSGNPQQVPYALASYFEGYNAVRRNGGFRPKTREYVTDIIRFANGM